MTVSFVYNSTQDLAFSSLELLHTWPLDASMDTGHCGIAQGIASPLPFDEWLARENLVKINAGPDGLNSLRQAQCNMRVTEQSGKTMCVKLT